MHLLLLVLQLVEDAEVGTQVFVLSLGYKIIYNGGLLLTISVDTTIALLQGDKAPGDIIVEHDMAEVVQVHALRTGVAGNEHSYLAVFLGKVAHQLFLLCVGHRAVKALHLFLV